MMFGWLVRYQICPAASAFLLCEILSIMASFFSRLKIGHSRISSASR